MIVVMKERATEAQVDSVIARLIELGMDVHRSSGATRTVLGVVGAGKVEKEMIEILEGVHEVMRISEPYKRASRSYRPEDTVVMVDDVRIGGDEVIVMAGPCSAETDEQCQASAAAVKRAGAKKFLIVDAAMNDLLRPALYGAWHDVLPARKKRGKAAVYDVVGPICESADFLARERLLAVAFAQELCPGHYKRVVRLLGHGLTGIYLAELHTYRCVGRVEIGDFLIGFERLSCLARPGVGVRDLQVLLPGFNQQPLLRIEIRELHRSFGVRGIELRYLLEHRDGFKSEAALAIAVGDPREVGNGVLDSARANIEVAESVDRCKVTGVRAHHLAVLINRRRDLSL